MVATFIPPIAFLFLFLTLLEDSGYMSRAALVADKYMRKLGLPGKAFVPLLVGFGCNVPAIMAARILQKRSDQITTMMMIPFMSCGARFPVYALFASAFFLLGSGLVMFSLYIVGILAALLTGFLLKKSLYKGEAEPFLIELPTYEIPLLKNLFLRTWEKLYGFIIKAGIFIVIVFSVLTFIEKIEIPYKDGNTTIMEWIGKKGTIVFQPMGMNENSWPSVVGLMTGVFAKEAIVGTIAAFYEEEEEEKYTLKNYPLLESFQESFSSIFNSLAFWQENEEGEVSGSVRNGLTSGFQNKTAAYAYLLFVLLYAPCMATIGAIAKEAGMKWALASVVWTTWLAYSVATFFYQMSLFTFSGILISLSFLFINILFYYFFKKIVDTKGLTES